jgi:hypothetical protein
VFRPDQFFKPLGHLLEGMVPTEIVGYEPVSQNITIVVPPTIPVTITRPFNLPQIFFTANGANSIFDKRHGI